MGSPFDDVAYPRELAKVLAKDPLASIATEPKYYAVGLQRSAPDPLARNTVV